MEAVEWQEEADDIKRKSLGANGILLEDIPILVHVRPVEGLSRRIDGTGECWGPRLRGRVSGGGAGTSDKWSGPA